MISFIPPRLRNPAITVVAGAAFAAAWLVRGGPLWWVSILSVVMTLVRAISVYVHAGEDSDEGALAGSRPDERQRLVGQRSRALAATAATVTAFLGLTVTIAIRSPAWWAFLVILVVIIFGYLFGLSNYAADTESPADEGSPSYARTPAS